MTSRNSIKFHNICLPHISSRKLLTKNSQNEYTELAISEYDVSEAMLPFTDYYTPREIYFSISHHLYEIIRRNITCAKAVYSFTIFQNQDQDNFEIIVKDITVMVDPDDTVESIHERVNILISAMPAVMFPNGPIVDYTLLFCKHETFPGYDSPINSNTVFHFDSCLICSDSAPKVLFCNCGHLCLCPNCYKKYNKKQCVSCRMLNTIVRIIE